MSIGAHDPRDRLVREKYFSLRPKPLERFLWQQGLPQAAERVFWLHWEEGMRSGDWCSQISIKRVASQCCIDTSTVTRAYQLLRSLELIRRADPGRDPENPFQQATAVTEVRVPRALLTELSRSPNRPAARGRREAQMPAFSAPQPSPAPAGAVPEAGPPHEAPRPTPRPSRQEIQALWGRASVAERARYFEASRSGLGRIDFDEATRLSSEDRAQILAQLAQLARARAEPPKAPHPAPTVRVPDAPRRRLSSLELARTRKRIGEAVPAPDVGEVLRQVVWATEEGALRRFDPPLALNIALKKIREGAWTRPNRMPPQWLRAQPETCSAA